MSHLRNKESASPSGGAIEKFKLKVTRKIAIEIDTIIDIHLKNGLRMAIKF